MEQAIKGIKDFFEHNLARALNLTRVSAPLFVRSGTGVNDDLNGDQEPIRFRVKGRDGIKAEIVQSLAKWKRMALARYGFKPGEGLYTDMNAIRPDESLDNLHSIYVDQWDWEKIIESKERNVETLKATVKAIYDVIRRTEFYVASRWSAISPLLPPKITFITAEELCARYPDLTMSEREDQVTKEYYAVFLVGIGGVLKDGRAHDGRAPDYDDWTTLRVDGGRGLNGDILFWHPVLKQTIEISSMGIRVDAEGLRQQLTICDCMERIGLDYHRALARGKLPQTIGGGIGQSRMCMYFLRTAHIGEVAVGIWPREMEEECSKAKIFLL